MDKNDLLSYLGTKGIAGRNCCGFIFCVRICNILSGGDSDGKYENRKKNKKFKRT